MDIEKLKKQTRSILVVNLGGIGDLLLSTPALTALKRAYPEAEISLLVDARAYAAAERLTCADRVYRMFASFTDGGLPLWWSSVKTAILLRHKRFDIAINMRTLVSASSAFKIRTLLRIINPKITAGRNTEGRGRFFDISIPETDVGEKHEMEYDMDLAGKLGADVTDRTIDYVFSDDDIGRVDSLLADVGLKRDGLMIGIHPGGKPSHRWPVENFAKTMRVLSEKTGASFIVTGNADERTLADGLVETARVRAVNLAGRLALGELGALIKRCNLFITNDTSTMHIAAILRVPTVAIFGPGFLTKVNPCLISDKVKVLYKKAVCAPCNKTVCHDMRCLKSVTPAETIEAALDFWKSAYR